MPAPTAATVSIAPVSRAGGEWTVDWERAHTDAQQVLDSIDFSKHDIMIWVPGTSCAGVHTDFEAAVRSAYQGTGASLSALQYEATWHLRESVPTGVATLKLVLEGIKAKLGAAGLAQHHILLAGESQGAWIIGEVMADPEVGSVANRAVLMGHPWLAAHQYTDHHDPRVTVVNHPRDQVSMPIKGDPSVALDAMIAIHTLNITKLGDVVRALAANPKHGLLLLESIRYSLPFIKQYLQDPHKYGREMTRAVEYLQTGRLDGESNLGMANGLGDLFKDIPTAVAWTTTAEQQQQAAIDAYSRPPMPAAPAAETA